MMDDNEDLKLGEEVRTLRGENTKSVFLLGCEIIKQNKEKKIRLFASESREEKLSGRWVFDSCVKRAEELMDKTKTYYEPLANGGLLHNGWAQR